MACHSERAKAAGMDSARKLSVEALDPANVAHDAKTWELVVRKLRAGMMPPAGLKRPDPPAFDTMIASFEADLDRAGGPNTPAPGLHRLNRTEYENVVRDLLHLDIDASKYLPSDDSTSGFDNIAGALGISSTLVEAYVSAAQKISRLAMGYPQEPTLAVYRTREDTSQNYHIEGLPFGTRGGLVVSHTFPSDGEYTLTVTPIFGDNMSPTGFGSVPCERIEVLLDGERLQLMDWQGGGRMPAANCGPGRTRPEVRGGQSGPEAFFGGRGGTPMRVRFKTTAGTHTVGATFLATNFAPLLDLDRQFLRSTVQTGPTPGYTFFPHVGTLRIEGPFEATQATESPSRRKIFVCTPKTAAEESACARRIVTNLATYAYRRPATPSDVEGLMEFYRFGRKEKDFDQGVEMALARVLASPQFIYRIEEEPASVRAGQPYRITDVDLASRLSFFLWSTAPDAELLRVAGQGRLRNPVVLEQQVRRMLKDPKANALARELRRPVAEPARPGRHGAAAAHLPGLRRPAAPGDAPRGGADLRHHRHRGSAGHRAPDRRLHLRQRAAGEALRHPEHPGQPVPARHAGRRAGRAQGPDRQGRVPGHDRQARAHLAGDARQVGDDQHPGDEPARSAGRRAAAAAARGRSERQGTVDAAEDDGPPRPAGLRAVPSADGSDWLRAGDVRRHRPGAHATTKARRWTRRRARSTARRSKGRAACATGWPPTTRSSSWRWPPRSCSPTAWDAAWTIATCRWCARWRATPAQSENRFSALVLGVVKSQPFQMNTRSVPAATTTASAGTTTPTASATTTNPGRN